MIKLCAKDKCCSCMACYNACHFDAIHIKNDELDVLYPEINDEKCRQCNKCVSACPVLNPVPVNAPRCSYALYTKEQFDRQTCASGGIATAMSRFVLEAGGIVFGCGYDDSGFPSYKKIENKIELEELKGSKYVYPYIGKVYNIVHDELKTGKRCLFIGLPCHVAGLLSYLGNTTQYSNLITVDLICHGAPPIKYLLDHVSSICPSHINISKISFRGIKDYYFTIYGKNDRIEYCKRQDEDQYFYAFMQGLILRNSCYNCQYASPKRVSDITIGDFWGIAPGALNGYAGKKSLALVNTERGADFFNSFSDLLVYEQRSIDEAIAGNDQLRHPSPHNTERVLFDNNYIKSRNFTKAVAATSIRHQTICNKWKNILMIVPRKIKNSLLNLLK